MVGKINLLTIDSEFDSHVLLAQSAVAIEYSDCISTEENDLQL